MENSQPHWMRSILYVLVWLVCCLLAVADMLAIREASLDILTAVQVQRIENARETQANMERIHFGFKMQAIDQVMLFVGGIIAMIFALGIEYYFRMGQKKGVLLQRIGRVVAIQVGIFVICVIILTLI